MRGQKKLTQRGICPLLRLWWWNWSTMTVATTDIPTITMVLAKYWPMTDGGQHLSFTITADGLYKTMNSHTTPSRKQEASLHRNMHMNAWRNWPIRGTESEVAGITSATISMKTVSESRTVMPGSRHKTPGEKSLLNKRRKEMHQGKDQELTVKYNRNSILSATQWLLTQADLLPRVCRQQEDQQSHGGEQHAGDEQIEGVKQGPPS